MERKKICCLLLSLLLIFPMATGFAADSGALEELPPTTWDSDYHFLESRDEPATITIFVNDAGANRDHWGIDGYSRWVERETGVKVEWEMPIANDNQKINLMIAADELPDMVFFPDFNVPALGTMMTDGYLYSLDELIDEYAPRFRALSLYENNAEYYRWEQGGELYYLPLNAWDRAQIKNTDTAILAGACFYRRQDIWEALGSPAMDTLEQVDAVLYEVKEKYPEMTNILAMWDALNHYGIESGPNMIYRAMGGKYKYLETEDGLISQARDPIYVDALAYINKLVRDGIVNISDFSDDGWQGLEAANHNGTLFLSAGPGWRIINGESMIKDVNPDYGYYAIEPFTQEGVDHYFAPHYDIDGWGGLVITQSAKDPKRCIEFYEFLSTELNQAAANKGVPGLHWEYTGPTGRWIKAVGKAEELMFNEGYGAWQEYTGGNLYRMIASVYYDSAGARADGVADPVRGRAFELAGKVDDFTAFTGLDPLSGSEEALINTKINDLWRSYMCKAILEAGSADEVSDIWGEFLSKADQAGLQQLEAFWTMKYEQLAELRAKLGDE